MIIHDEFQIWGKIVRTTTNNGRNFLKAFQMFGEDENNNMAVEPVGCGGNTGQPEEEDGKGRLEDSKILGVFWSDYLLNCEDLSSSCPLEPIWPNPRPISGSTATT